MYVKKGDIVSQGYIIGTSGSTGNAGKTIYDKKGNILKVYKDGERGILFTLFFLILKY
jgi:hypothetical protein